MVSGACKRWTFAATLLLAGLGAGSGCRSQTAGTAGAVSCFDISGFKVLYVSGLNENGKICRLELTPPPGFEFVDKTGKRLPYHPYVLVKKSNAVRQPNAGFLPAWRRPGPQITQKH
jgi:hypothetical protein